MRVAFIMDPIETINPKKDTTLAMMLEAQRRGWDVFELNLSHLSAENAVPSALAKKVELFDSTERWFRYTQRPEAKRLTEFDLLIMRKDPPFNMEYIYATYLLELAEKSGVPVVNKPQSLRDANEKLFTLHFPQLTPPNMVTRRRDEILKFLDRYGKSVIKPPDGMGGKSIFVLSPGDPNTNVIIETLTQNQTRFVLIQKYIDEARFGDKRIILIGGEPFPYAVKRIPPADDFRGNLAVGASAEGSELSERDLQICREIGPELRERGLHFVGIDILGGYLSEINVTSPTGVREIDRFFNTSVCKKFFDYLEEKILK